MLTPNPLAASCLPGIETQSLISPLVLCVLRTAFLAAALVTVAYAKKKPASRKVSPFSSDAFAATLSGVLEIPKNDTEAARNAVGDPYGSVDMGLIIYKKNSKSVWLEYRVAAYFLQGGVPPTMTHVHNATEGSNGPKVLDLPCEYQTKDDGILWKCNGSLGKDLTERTVSFVSTLKGISKNPTFFAAALVAVAYARKKPVPRKPTPAVFDTVAASLYGDYEVPKNDSEAARKAVNDPNGAGHIDLKIYKRNGQPVWLEYEASAFGLVGEMSPIQTHVHNAAAGSNGPKVLDLPCEYKWQENMNIYLCNGVLGKNSAELTPTLVSTLKAILANPSAFCANIHTVAYPDGAVRGQFEKAKKRQ
ncbi:unnamed protein product [Closterium sp. Yama58-4]|nr:unnamed protein product [Closterium sp. Yama58-4]